MPSLETTLLGWSLDQWAEAAAWFSRVYGYTPLPDLPGARRVWHAWKTRRIDAPSSKRLIVLPIEERPRRSERDVLMCDDPRLLPPLPLPRGIEMNRSWAVRAMVNVALQTGVPNLSPRPVDQAPKESPDKIGVPVEGDDDQGDQRGVE